MLPKLNDLQLDRLSEISGNLVIVFLASLITPIFSGGVLNLLSILFGGTLGVTFFIFSLLLLAK